MITTTFNFNQFITTNNNYLQDKNNMSLPHFKSFLINFEII